MSNSKSNKKLNPMAPPWVPKITIPPPAPTHDPFEMEVQTRLDALRPRREIAARRSAERRARESNFDPRDLMDKICKIGKELESRDKDLGKDFLRQFNERDHNGLTKLLEDFRKLLAPYEHVNVTELCNEQMCKLRSIIYN